MVICPLRDSIDVWDLRVRVTSSCEGLFDQARGATRVEDVCDGGAGCPPQSVAQLCVYCVSGH